jgi:hypothetical protein
MTTLAARLLTRSTVGAIPRAARAIELRSAWRMTFMSAESPFIHAPADVEGVDAAGQHEAFRVQFADPFPRPNDDRENTSLHRRQHEGVSEFRPLLFDPGVCFFYRLLEQLPGSAARRWP